MELINPFVFNDTNQPQTIPTSKITQEDLMYAYSAVNNFIENFDYLPMNYQIAFASFIEALADTDFKDEYDLEYFIQQAAAEIYSIIYNEWYHDFSVGPYQARNELASIIHLMIFDGWYWLSQKIRIIRPEEICGRMLNYCKDALDNLGCIPECVRLCNIIIAGLKHDYSYDPKADDGYPF